MRSRSAAPQQSGFSRLWWATAIGGGIAIVAIAILPVDSFQRSFVARGLGIAAIALFFYAMTSLPSAVRKIWLWVGVFLVITVIADMIFDYQALVLEVRPFPGITDVLYISAFICAVTGLIKLSRLLNPRADVAAWIDISIMVIAASAFIGIFVINSMWETSEVFSITSALDLIYPLLSLLLLTALVRLFILPHSRNIAITLLGASCVCFLACDLIFSNQLIVGRTPVVAIEVLWAAALICLPLAVMSPGASQFTPVDSRRASEVTPTRQVLIGVSAIGVPAVVLVELLLTGTLVANWLLPVIIVMVALVLLRLHLLLRASQRQTTALAALAFTDALTGLPNKQGWDLRVQELLSQVREGSDVCTIAMLDIDNFTGHRESKSQHQVDLLLISASLAWLAELSVEDVLARCGMDEFALLIRRSSLAETQEVLRRVLRSTPADLSVSVGAALLRQDEDPAQAQARASSALYAAMAEVQPMSDIEQPIPS
ncbi:MAG: GGDEF domain-containing protein [Actinomycetota bacterium]|nr:GGDEF domain-containing protein [Actinomycetota bacterium]